MTDAGRELLARARARRELREVRTAPSAQSVDEVVRQLREGSRRLLEETRQLRERMDGADRRREAAERAAAEDQALSEAESLSPRAAKLFRDWRGLGRSAAGAMDEVRRSGIEAEEQLAEAFQARGLSAEAAEVAARGRGGGVRPVDAFDELVETFRRHGLSPEAARLAAIGRDGTEREARAGLNEAAAQAEVDAAFWEAARAAAAKFGLDPAAAVTHVKAKVREWPALSLAEGAARLRAYAHELTS